MSAYSAAVREVSDAAKTVFDAVSEQKTLRICLTAFSEFQTEFSSLTRNAQELFSGFLNDMVDKADKGLPVTTTNIGQINELTPMISMTIAMITHGDAGIDRKNIVAEGTNEVDHLLLMEIVKIMHDFMKLCESVPFADVNKLIAKMLAAEINKLIANLITAENPSTFRENTKVLRKALQELCEEMH